jgi:hypothetical protein
MSEKLMQKILSDVRRWKSTPDVSEFIIEHLMFRDDNYEPSMRLARREPDGSWHVLRPPETREEVVVYIVTLLETATGMKLTATEESVFLDGEKLGRRRTNELIRILCHFAVDLIAAINDDFAARQRKN